MSADAEPAADRIARLRIDEIRPSKYQVRRVFDEEGLRRLADSIKQAGVMQPVLVRRVPGTPGYELVAGERRWRAARMAGLDRLPAVVAELSDEGAAEWGLIENVQREELGPLERADGLRLLCEWFGLTHAQAAERVGLDRSTVTNLIRLTELDPVIREMLERQEITLGHARALLSASPAAQVRLAREIVEKGWSVRETEERVARSKGGEGAPGETSAAASGGEVGAPGAGLEVDPRVAARAELEKQLGSHLGTKVRVTTERGGKRGKLVIEFYGLDHFDGLMERIGFSMT